MMRKVASYSIPAAVALSFGVVVIMLTLLHARAVRSDRWALDRACGEKASEFRSEATLLAEGSAMLAYTSHYNKQRRQCLVDITSNRSGDVSVYDQIINPKDGTFVASRTRPASVSPATDEVIVMGAPVALQEKSAAQAWFKELMTK